MDVKVPKVIKVGVHPYTVKLDQNVLDEDRAAEANHRLQEIRIRPGYKPDKMMELLIHELLHCANLVYCARHLTEDDIDHLGEGVAQIFAELGLELDWSAIEGQK